ncbi:hypothetical protein ABT304_16100 [Nocardioides sp. NPDC000445]|uniref:hypothetical protein n=1 Tax=Nocardioides sp. NPDC000445 TaxID=3154257 RepID=UPI003324E26F
MTISIPESLTTLADDLRTAADTARDGFTDNVAELDIPGTAAGNSSGGPGLITAHVNVSDAASTAVGRLAGVLEQDMDDIYACAFLFATTDEDAAEQMRSEVPRIGGIFPYNPTVDWSVYDGGR